MLLPLTFTLLPVLRVEHDVDSCKHANTVLLINQGVMSMETTLAVEELNDRKLAEMVSEEATRQLEDVLDEVVDLAKNTEFKQSTKDDLAIASEDPGEKLNDESLPMDDLELDIDLAEESTEPQTEVEPVAEETESAPRRLIDTEYEIMAMLAKTAGANDSGDSSPRVTGKDSVAQDMDKGLAAELRPPEENASDAPEEGIISGEMVDELVAAINNRSSKHFSSDQESESEIEAVDGHLGQASTPLSSDGQLASLLSKKIEATVTCLVEERLSAVVERVILDKINRIFATVG